MKEWKDIIGYEGVYQINKNGDVKNTKRNKLLKPSLKSSGYYGVGLHNKGIRKDFFIHRLVAIHFIPNTNNYEYINHKDGNKTNNSIDNLEWITSSKNTFHAYQTGLLAPTRSKKVHQINIETNEIIYTYDSCVDAINNIGKEYNAKANINACARGERPTAYGFKWEFA